jgi:hypothetical protein
MFCCQVCGLLDAQGKLDISNLEEKGIVCLFS